ncbi:hypothetical protein F5B21DRAFT_217774 [Xylaria acuta]|nr:hypothetical protein F5B21DRAFT_217774 [Xylaria acuta]
MSCSGLFCNYTLADNRNPLRSVFGDSGFSMINGPRPSFAPEFSTLLSAPDNIKPYTFNVSMMAHVPWLEDGDPDFHYYKDLSGYDQWTRFDRLVFADFAVIDVPLSYLPCLLREPYSELHQTVVSSENVSCTDAPLSFRLGMEEPWPRGSNNNNFCRSSGIQHAGARAHYQSNRPDAFGGRLQGAKPTRPHSPYSRRAQSYFRSRFPTPFCIRRMELRYVGTIAPLGYGGPRKVLATRCVKTNQPKPDEDVYAGKVWVQQVCIRVAWLWLIYTASILAASLVLFAYTIIEAFRRWQ